VLQFRLPFHVQYSCTCPERFSCLLRTICIHPILDQVLVVFLLCQLVEIPSVTQAVTTNSGKQIQNINLNGIRGFLIPDDSQFNKLVVVTDTFSDPDQFYKIQVGVMLNWETWEALLTDPSFFDNNKPNNNQNKKTSNYSDLNGFEIRLAMLYQVKKNNIITDYHAIQDNGAVFDYDLDKNGSPKFTTTHVYKDANDVVLPLKLIVDEDNEVTVTNEDGSAKTSSDDFNGQIRLEVFEQGNEKSIHIISSIDGVIEGDILKPLDGETLMNKSLVGDNYTSKCLIDGVQLGLKQYSISSEIQERILAFENSLSVNYDGVDAFVLCGNDLSLHPERTTTFSYSAWIKVDDLTAERTVMTNRGPGGVFKGIRLFIKTDGKIQVDIISSGITNGIQVETTAGGTITTGTWFHVAFTYNGSSSAAGVTIYKNAVSQGVTTITDTLTATIVNTLIGFGIGNNTSGTGRFDGNIDEVSVWDKTLTSGEITEIYNLACPDDLSVHSASANLVSWWRMGEGSTFPTIIDEIFTNDGTMTNMIAGDIEADTIC